METIRKPLSVVLGLMAAVVLFHFVLNPFYEDAVDPISVWHVLNWMMAVGVIITLVLTYVRRERLGADDAATMHICVNVAFYAAAVLAILFFWNWFDDLTAGRGRAERNTRVLLGGHQRDVRRAAGHGERAAVEGWGDCGRTKCDGQTCGRGRSLEGRSRV